MTNIRGNVARLRAGSSARAARNRIELRGLIEERSRRTIYRDDVEFAPEPEPNPPGSMNRFVEPIRELAARGMSQLDIANELEISQGSVGNIMRKHSIKKGPAKR